jgi:hypothetical protein
MVEKKYAKYVSPAPILMVPHEGYTWESIYAHKGQLQSNVSVAFHYIDTKFEEGPPHKHESDQLMFFFGSNLEKISDFDAEVTLALGEEHEIQTITKPSVITIPAGLLHCPLRFERLTKPVLFLEIMLQRSYDRVLSPEQKKKLGFESSYTKLI